MNQDSVPAETNQLLSLGVGADATEPKSSNGGREKSRRTDALSVGVCCNWKDARKERKCQGFQKVQVFGKNEYNLHHSPLRAELVVVELQPLQRNNGRGGLDVARLQLGDCFGERHHGDADIFRLFL